MLKGLPKAVQTFAFEVGTTWASRHRPGDRGALMFLNLRGGAMPLQHVRAPSL